LSSEDTSFHFHSNLFSKVSSQQAKAQTSKISYFDFIEERFERISVLLKLLLSNIIQHNKKTWMTLFLQSVVIVVEDSTKPSTYATKCSIPNPMIKSTFPFKNFSFKLGCMAFEMSMSCKEELP